MSRGLGRLQRFIKDQIYRAEREYKREAVALRGRRKLDPKFDDFEDVVKRFTVVWWDVRDWVEENPDFNHGPYRISGPTGATAPIKVGPSGPITEISASLERSTKRALYSLVKRGEIAQDKWSKPAQYFTKEMYERLNEAGKAVMEGFARMKEEGRDI